MLVKAATERCCHRLNSVPMACQQAAVSPLCPLAYHIVFTDCGSIYELVQERCNSSALAMELCLSRNKPLIFGCKWKIQSKDP